MIAFFTSTLGGSYKVDGKRYPTYLPDKNGFAEHLRKYWKENARVLFVPASPEAMERNGQYAGLPEGSLSDERFPHFSVRYV